ncbi:MAG: GmrSD restriction endonuclease domain-containing protein [Anaerolineae bacterium]|jgi:hypothetical protein|nr:DUF262 domain-containing protein [Chloroflexota bacterium]
MPAFYDRIKPTSYSIHTYLERLRAKEYQIPTFQREVVWDRNAVKKLWDSIMRYYPIGSILIWITDVTLQSHREIGGHVIAKEQAPAVKLYVLDGQQRTTAMLTGLFGGSIEGQPDFDPTLYIDLTVEDEESENVATERFLFWDEIITSRNAERWERYENGEIVRLHDIMYKIGELEKKLVNGRHPDWEDPVRERLRDSRDVLGSYQLSFIELSGIEVAEVCEIFERVNQEGKSLSIFDIVVAKTFRLQTPQQKGFYLRELVDQFRSETPGEYPSIPDITYLQSLAIFINRDFPELNVSRVSPWYLNRIRAEHIEAVWPYAPDALRRMFDFLDNHLHIRGPRLIPNGYLFLTLASHFYRNPSPNYAYLRRYFWHNVCSTTDWLRDTTGIRQHVALLEQARTGEPPLPTFVIDRESLRATRYRRSNRLATGILCLLANQQPHDWREVEKQVLNDVYYRLVDTPNLHHVFPTNFLASLPNGQRLQGDSMLNIVYLSQLTNLKISDTNPMLYLRELDRPGFDAVLREHLVPLEVLQWARAGQMPDDALHRFLEARIDLIIEVLRTKLEGVPFQVIDTGS